jgi:alginate O-acetyltransferase complex protein AlgI
MLLGFHLMENFNAPFLASNINEFWRRWHISLTSWCRAYVYTPVASGLREPIAGIFMSMVVIGLWHELSLRFLGWGLYHGAGIAVWTAVSRWRMALWPPASVPPPLAALGRMASVLLTFNFVVAGFAFAKEPSLGEALRAYRILMGLG